MKKLPSSKQFEQNWSQGVIQCPECGTANNISDLTLLAFNPCKKCGKSFFAAKKISSFFLFEPAGGGGMGSVYKEVSTEFPNRLIAVKLLSREDCNKPTNVKALLNEARISSLFKESQYIAACLDAGFDNGEYFTAMDFIEGERLD